MAENKLIIKDFISEFEANFLKIAKTSLFDLKTEINSRNDFDKNRMEKFTLIVEKRIEKEIKKSGDKLEKFCVVHSKGKHNNRC